MPTDKFLIAPFKSGLMNNLEPWLIPEDAFDALENALVFRGKVKKRFGTTYTGTSTTSATAQLNSRLRIAITGGSGVGITDGSGNATGTVPGATFKIGQMFSVGTQIFTVYQNGAMYKNSGTGTGTYNTGTGVYTFAGVTINTQIYFYPTEPVMGFTTLDIGTIGNHTTIAYDTQFAYRFTGSAWDRVGTQFYTGANSDYYWSCNWTGATTDAKALFSTNFNTVTPDNMYYTPDGTTWTAFKPKFLVAGTADQNIVVTARIILPFKNRLVLLNTFEIDAGAVTTAHTNRCRYSQNGSPLDAAAWYESGETGYQGGGFIDAPIQETLVSAQFIRDRLIVYFENSTWELAYTGNELLPFTWQQLDGELGSQSTFSTIPFNRNLLAIGTNGIHSCNGVNVTRIDDKIPDEVFKSLSTSNAVKRTFGIRDFFAETAYWTLPTQLADDTNLYPDKVLVYNYDNRTWAVNDDTITAFGYLEQTTAPTWQNTLLTWAEYNYSWDSGTNLASHKKVIAGNQFGFVFVVENDVTTNAPVIIVANIDTSTNRLTIPNHNLKNGDFIKINNFTGVTVADSEYFSITKTDEDTIELNDASMSGTYAGGGTISRVSRINIRSKEWNPYISKGRGTSIVKIKFCVDKTTNGAITVDHMASSTDLSLISEGAATGASFGTYVLETSPYDPALVPLESIQKRLWHSLFFQSHGTAIQIRMYFTDSQMLQENIVESDFSLEGMMLETRVGEVL